jgi:membrane protease subunit HflK
MPWNESGGNQKPGPRNPWDRKSEGPADLDEAVRNLKRKLAQLFGGERTGGTGGPVGTGRTGGNARGGWLAALLAGLWLASGFYLVGPAEKAVVTRFGRFTELTSEGPNWRLPWPIESKLLVNTQEFLSFADQTRMLTQDLALVDISFAVQYRRADPKAFVFSIVEPERTLGEASESAIREVVAQSTLDWVLEKGRQEIVGRTKTRIQKTLDGYKAGLEVISVNLQDVKVPEQVAPAQKDAIKAREDQDRVRIEAETYSNDLLPRARGDAQRQLLDAEAYRQSIVATAVGESARFAQLAAAYEKAPAVTRQRLYIETLEAVLSAAAKVIVDVRGSGNTIYLPLDKLLDRRAQQEGARPSTLPDVTVTPGPPRPDSVDSAGDLRSRSRGSR